MLELRRSRDRGYDDHGWLKTYYTFSYGEYYDPEHVDFGSLKVLNEERIKPGKGYSRTRQDEEFLTYLIEGELRHEDALGNNVLLRAGVLQCLSAGKGVNHTESNSSASQEAHLLQICLAPAETGLTPTYEQRHFPADERRGRLQLLASQDGAAGSVIVHQDVRLHGGLFHEAQRAQFEVAKGRRAFVHVVRGSIAVNETRLNVGDGLKISAPSQLMLQHGRDGEVLIFDLPADPLAVKRKATPVPKAKAVK